MATALFTGMDIATPSPEEQETLSTAYQAYFESMGMTDLPPGVALLAVVGMYAAPRLLRPEPLAKLKRFGADLIGGLTGKPRTQVPQPELKA